MAISTDLIVELADIDRLSIKCPNCQIGVEVSTKTLSGISNPSEVPGKRHAMPSNCPGCGLDWEGLQTGVKRLSQALIDAQRFSVSLRIPRPE